MFIEFLEKNINKINSEFLIPDVVFNLSKKCLMEVSILKTNAKLLGVTYKENKENVVRE